MRACLLQFNHIKHTMLEYTLRPCCFQSIGGGASRVIKLCLFGFIENICNISCAHIGEWNASIRALLHWNFEKHSLSRTPKVQYHCYAKQLLAFQHASHPFHCAPLFASQWDWNFAAVHIIDIVLIMHRICFVPLVECTLTCGFRWPRTQQIPLSCYYLTVWSSIVSLFTLWTMSRSHSRQITVESVEWMQQPRTESAALIRF